MATPEHLPWLKSIAGELATATLSRIEETLPWFAKMPPARRAAVGSVAQAGITSFVEWYGDPHAQPWVAADVFAAAPRELLRSVSLQETLQLIRVVVEMVEQRIVGERPEMREAVLRYSRDIAFSAANVYARAAEARGLWDARLEALVVDSIITTENSPELASRVAALGWRAQGPVAVLVGQTPEAEDPDLLRKIARKSAADVLVGYHAQRQVCVLGFNSPSSRIEQSLLALSKELAVGYGPGTLVLGTVARSINESNRSAKSALAAMSVVGADYREQRPLRADDVLPERALAGDATARQDLIQQVYLPLATKHSDLTLTLRNYLNSGRSLENTARLLFVHPNTVRYRLRRIQELIGWDPTEPADAFVLKVSLILGQIADSEAGIRR